MGAARLRVYREDGRGDEQLGDEQPGNDGRPTGRGSGELDQSQDVDGAGQVAGYPLPDQQSYSNGPGYAASALSASRFVCFLTTRNTMTTATTATPMAM